MNRILYALLGLVLATAAAFGAGIGGTNRQDPAVNSGWAGSSSSLNNYLAVTSALPGVAMSGATNTLSGTSGRGLINITAWYGGTKIGLDQPPACGPISCTWTLNIDVTAVPAGAQTLAIVGYTQPAGNGSYINNQLNFPVTVGQAVSASISYIGSSPASSSAGSGAVCAPPVPTGTQPGDLILGYVPNQVNAAGDTPPGWNIAKVAGNNIQAINSIQSATLYYRFATGAAADAPSFTNLSYPACMLRTYRGVSASTPFDSWGPCIQTGATTCSISGLAATANTNEVVVAFYDFNVNTATITGPTGFGNQATDLTQRSVWSGDKTLATAGTAPGPLTATSAGAANYWDGIAVSLIATGGAQITSAPTITTQPVAMSISPGQTGIFSAAASGNPPPTLQWQQSADNGATWQNAWGIATGQSYTTPPTIPFDGVNLAGLEFGSAVPGTLNTDFFLPTLAELNYYVGKGITTIRLPFMWERLQPTNLNTTVSSTYLGYIQTFLANAQTAGAKVILDLHNYAKYKGVALGNGNVNAAALANVWTQIATAVKSAPALAGYDIMNEPVDMPTTAIWPAAAQVVITAIRAVDTVTPIYIEGDCYSAAWNWNISCNTTLQTLTDPSNKLIFEAHQYADANSSGQYAAATPPNFDAEVTACGGCDLLNGGFSLRIPPFTAWLNQYGFRGIIGEYSIPGNDTRWQTTMGNGLAYMNQNCLGSTYWAGGPGWGSATQSPMAIEPIGGVDRPQMATLLQYAGKGACYNGYKYRVVATNSQGAAISNAVALSVVTGGGGTIQGAAVPCTGSGGWGTGNCGTATVTPTNAARVNDFLNSTGFVIGGGGGASCDTVSNICATQQNYIDMLNYVGTRNVRGISSVDTDHPPSWGVAVCQAANVRFDYGIESGVTMVTSDFANTEIPFAKILASAKNSFGDSCLVTGEGPNEPDNWCLTYNGVQGGGSGQCGSWLPVAQLQRDWFAAWKADAVLKNYPMMSLSHNGGESDNAGVQFLTVPTGGAGTLVSGGTAFADYANVHNYESSNGTADNGAWFAADAIQHEIVVCGNNQCDMFHSDYINPWRLAQSGHPVSGMDNTTAYTIPKITSETGLPDSGDGGAGQGRVLLHIWLAQYKLGYKYTYIYQLRDNEGGFTNAFGVFSPNFTPKTSATMIRNFTSILADRSSAFTPGSLSYTIANEPATVHDLLMQKSNGHIFLVVWDERPIGEATDNITVNLGGPHTGNVYDPVSGSGAQSAFSSVSSVNLAMTDHPLIIELTDTQLGLSAPVIGINQPADQNAFVGNTVAFATDVSGNPPPACQWSKSGGSLGPTATNCASLTYPLTGTLALSDNGATFSNTAINSQGSATSRTAVLAVANQSSVDAFAVTLPLPNATVSGPGFQIVVATGATWLNAACYYGSAGAKVCQDTPPVCVSGSCTFTLSLDTTQLPDGLQTISIAAFSTPAGVAGWTSTSLTLQLNVCNNCGPSPAVIASGQPANQNGIAGGTVTFTAAVTGNPPPTCQWSKNGASLGAGARNCLSLTYPLTGTLVIGDNGATFSLSATNANGTALSRTAVLAVTTVVVGAGFDQFGLPNTPTTPTQAVTNFAFLQSLGYGSWPPNSGPVSNMVSMYEYTGMRWARGTNGPTAAAGNDSYLKSVVNQVNADDPNKKFKLSYILDGQNGCTISTYNACYSSAGIGTGANPANGTEIYNMVQMANAGILKLVEDFNEPDNFAKYWNGTVWGCGASCTFQGSWNIGAQAAAYIYQQVLANPTLGGKVAFTTMTYIGGSADNAGLQYGLQIPSYGTGFITTGGIGIGTKFADVLAQHVYYGPSDGAPTDPNGSPRYNQYWDMASHCCTSGGESLYSGFVLTWAHNFAGLTVPDIITKPAVITEGGSATTDQATQAAAVALQEVEGFFAGCAPGASTCSQGIKATSLYNMVDNDGEFGNTFGLYTTSCGGLPDCSSNPTLTPKLSATYLHNLTTILNDSTPNFTPGSTNWSMSGCLSGGTQNMSVCHGGLLQSANGHFWLLVMADSAATPVSPTVNYGQTFGHVNVYDIAAGTGVQSTHNNTSGLTLSFPRRGIQIIEMYP